MNQSNSKDQGLSFKTISLKCDMMGLIPNCDQDLVSMVEGTAPFNDEAVSHLLGVHKDRNITPVIRAHLLNISNTPAMQVSDAMLDRLWEPATGPLNSLGASTGSVVLANCRVSLSFRSHDPTGSQIVKRTHGNH